LGLPVELPTLRGALLTTVLPSYSPDNPLSEWGMGWAVDLSLRRFRLRGDLDFATDDLQGPWGRLVQGTDGARYPDGLQAHGKVDASGGDYLAHDGAGTTWRFGGGDTVTAPSGTYAWMLHEVTTVLGDRTELVWFYNASGRPFLSTVRWGGRSGVP